MPRTGDAPIMKPYDNAKVDARVRVNKAYKMFVGGAFVRSESGRYFQVQGAPEHEDADPDTVNVPRGSRKDVRDAVLAREERVGRLGEAHRVQPRADPLSPRRGDGVASARARRSRSCAAARARRRPRPRSTPRSIASCSTPASPTSSSRCSRRRTPSPGRTSTSACPSRWARSASSRRIAPRSSGSSRRSCRSSRAATRSSRSRASAIRARAIVWSECIATSDMPGGVINILTGHAKELVDRTWRSTARSSASTRGSSTPTCARRSRPRAPTT